MLTVRELYEFLQEHGVAGNGVDILYRDSDSDNVCWISHDENKSDAMRELGDSEVDSVDIYANQK